MRPTSHDITDLEREVRIAGLDLSVIDRDQQYGTLVAITCPECHGPLWEIGDDGPLRYRCRVGHAYTAEAMDSGLASQTEEALWVALNTLEESAKLSGRLAAQARSAGDRQSERRYMQSAQRYRAHADVIRQALGDVAGMEDLDDSTPEASTEPAG